MRVGFSGCVLDTDRHELSRNGTPVAVEPQVFAVLSHLVTHRERMVPKTELLDEIWGDQFVSESTLTSRIKSARRAVGDTGRDQRVIKTVHGHGYRFVAPVDADAPDPTSPTSVPAAVDGPDPLAGVADLIAAVPTAGRGGAVEVAGASAIHLAHLVEAAVATPGAGTALGRACATGDHRPFGCVVEAIGSLEVERPGALDGLPARCRSELERVRRGDLPTTRSRLVLAVREAIASATASGPVVLLLEDLDRADPETVGLVDELVWLTRRQPLAVVAAQGGTTPLLRDADWTAVRDDSASALVSDPEAMSDHLRTALTAVAVGGRDFDDLELAAATGAAPEACRDLLDTAFAAGLLESAPGRGYRFTDPVLASQLATPMTPHRRAEQHRATARRLAEAGADPARVADHLLDADEGAAAVGPACAATRRAAGAQLHTEVLTRTATVLPYATADAERFELLSLRADALAATGDADAMPTYRKALGASPPAGVGGVRARMARLAAITGDQATARDAIDGVVPDGGPDDGLILLATAVVAYFDGDLDRAEELLDGARRYALEPGAPAPLLDIITLRGLIAHNRGQWFDQLRRELRAAEGNAQLATTIADSHLCVAEFLLYGPTPYDEVVTLAHGLQEVAEATGARPAAAFAICLAGEAELLAGDLEAARVDLLDAVARFRAIDADAGLAHALQRLAEVELAAGDPTAATRLVREALPVARWSAIDRHLVQRCLGTLIAAAPDREAAAAAADEARLLVGERRACEHCEIFVALPSAIAYAEVGRLDEAREDLHLAEQSARVWEGPAWPAAIDEARAVLARAEGDDSRAAMLLAAAADGFENAGHVLDAERCRESLAD